MALIHGDCSHSTAKFLSTVEKLLTLARTQPVKRSLAQSYLEELNKLDYKSVNVKNNNIVLGLIGQLCNIVQPSESSLVRVTCKFLTSLTQSNVALDNETFSACLDWVQRVLISSGAQTHANIFILLKSFLIAEQFRDINLYLPSLVGANGLFTTYLNPINSLHLEVNYHVVGCLEGILLYNHKGDTVQQKYVYAIKDAILDIASSVLSVNFDRIYCSKILSSCLHVLHIIIVNKMLPNTADFTGEILGVVQVFLFHGLDDYPAMKPQQLRPAAMNLPERLHVVPKCKNLKEHKAKSRRQPGKKPALATSNVVPDCKGIGIYSSDSDASDTEANSSLYADSKVRLEAVRLLQALIENSQSRDIFGYWPQVVATGSRSDARVLARSILKEPASKVKQNALSTLTQLLIDAKSFLMHAEDVHQTSFITFFGSVCLMIKELHLTLFWTLNTEKNVAVLTHALKCVAALIQGTPYSRLKPGLITQLMKNCRPYIFHKDPTIRVAALSAFEAAASCDPITPEIYAVLAKESMACIDPDQSQSRGNSASEASAQEEVDEEEVDIEDIKNGFVEICDKDKTGKEGDISLLVQVSLENISNKELSTPVRLQSLKLIGRMAFNTGSLVFSNLVLVTGTLVTATQDPETQVILHACRVLEIMAGCLTSNDTDNQNAGLFWSMIFERVTGLVQHPQTILREAGCDCLGSIGAATFSQLPRQKAVLIITILFGAVRDEESAVRAAALRALGMLVTLQPIEDETGFLMDLADIVCTAAGDKNLGVRVKGAWAMANLCDCLLKKKDCEDSEPLPLEAILPKLYAVSVKASGDSDKVKCNAVRALGSILRLCSEREILGDTSAALDSLINCAMLENDMKVRWNACRAIGLILGHCPDNVLPSSWRDQVFPALCSLICDSPNFKVRTNAAWALYSCNTYGRYTTTLWKSIALAFENSQHVPSYVEYPHRDALVQQLCLTLSHVAACTKVSELQNLWAEISDHVEDISNCMKQFQENILPEKIGDLIKAKSELENHVKTGRSAEDRQIAQALANIFERTKYYDNLDATSKA